MALNSIVKTIRITCQAMEETHSSSSSTSTSTISNNNSSSNSSIKKYELSEWPLAFSNVLCHFVLCVYVCVCYRSLRHTFTVWFSLLSHSFSFSLECKTMPDRYFVSYAYIHTYIKSIFSGVG